MSQRLEKGKCRYVWIISIKKGKIAANFDHGVFRQSVNRIVVHDIESMYCLVNPKPTKYNLHWKLFKFCDIEPNRGKFGME